MKRLTLNLETNSENVQKLDKTNNVTAKSQKQKIASTLQRKSPPKDEITIPPEQYKEVKWLYWQAGENKPGWLRRQCKLNVRRRKQINDILEEAGLNGVWCGHCQHDDWSTLLHEFWHAVNGIAACNLAEVGYNE